MRPLSEIKVGQKYYHAHLPIVVTIISLPRIIKEKSDGRKFWEVDVFLENVDEIRNGNTTIKGLYAGMYIENKPDFFSKYGQWGLKA